MKRCEFSMFKRICAVLFVALALSTVAQADSVRLKRVAVVEPDQAVRLIDVAELEGIYASTLARTVLIPKAADLLGAQGSGEISLDRLRGALHDSGANLSRLSFSGRVCVLRERSGAPESRNDSEPSEVEQPWRTVEDWVQASEVTVEIAIVRNMLRDLKVEPDRLRVRFIDAPDGILDLSTASKRTVVKPISSLTSAVVLLKIERYKASGSLDRVETVKAEIAVLRPVLKVREQVSRREVLSGGVLEATEQWLSPSVDAVHAGETMDYIGQIATTRLMPGTVLLRSQVEKPIAVERNATVTVIYHGGGFVIESQGKAREAGRLGELIEVRLSDSKSTVLARVDGPYRVIVVGR